MKSLIFICFCLSFLTAHASQSVDICTTPEVDQQWQDVVEKYPSDPLLVKLSSFRSDLCEMMESNTIDSNTGSFMWEQALTAAVMECAAREQQAQHRLIRLFGTF